MSSCAVKDWQWLARLMERLTHRGLLWCGIIAAVIIGLVMHDIHLDIGNGVVISIHSLSSNNHANGGHIWDLFPSSWGRYLTTYFTHSEYQPREMKLSSSSSSSSYADNIHLEARPIRFHHTGSSITSDKYPLPFERSLPEGKSEETDSKKKNIDKVSFTAMLTDEIHTRGTFNDIYLERSSVTCSTHSEHHSSEMNFSSSSSSPYQATYIDPKFGDPTEIDVVVPRFDGESRPVGQNELIPPMHHVETQGTSKTFANETILWGAIDRGVNAKIVTIGEATSVDDDGHHTLEIIQPICNYHDVFVYPFQRLEDGEHSKLPHDHTTTNTFNTALMIAINTKCSTNQYAVTQQFLEEYRESATQTVQTNGIMTEDSLQSNMTAFEEYFHGTTDPPTFVITHTDNHVNSRGTFNRINSLLCRIE